MDGLGEASNEVIIHFKKAGEYDNEFIHHLQQSITRLETVESLMNFGLLNENWTI